MKDDKLSKVKVLLKKDIGSKRINYNILALFLKQLSLLVDSSVSIYDSLEIIKSQRIDNKLNKSLGNISARLNQGYQTYQAFKTEKAAFGSLVTAFFKSGDESGNLSYILDELSKYLTEDSKNKSKIKEAFIYPIILLLVTIFVVIIMLTKVLPTFVLVFESSNTPLPKPTKILLGISKFLANNGFTLLLMILLLVFLIILLRRNTRYRYKLDRLLFNIKIFKKFRLLNIEYQITSLLYILKMGDVSIIDSIDIIKDAFNNTYLRKKLDNIKNNLSLGKSLSESFEDEKIFSNLLISMIRIGENSGDMAKSLKKASDYYQSSYIYKLKRLSSLAEPLLILIMAAIVAFVVFSVAIPMFDSVNTINF